MQQLEQLDSKTHRDCRIVENSAGLYARERHVLHIRAAEVGNAVSRFPVFMSRSQQSGDWALSAVAALEPGTNLFVEDGVWAAAYQPIAMQTYPLFLMRIAETDEGYTVGIDGRSSALSKQSGEPLFDETGQPSLRLDKITSLLEASIEGDLQTQAFTDRLEQLRLCKSINVNVHYQDGSVQTITGLHTIDEDKLQSLPAEQIHELNSKGYLVLVHAMLVSIFQLNSLVRKHNQIDGNRKVSHAKLEVARAPGLGDAGLG